jgi:transcription initiation factor TFIIF subunit beta
VAHESVASAMDGPEYSRIIREQGSNARNQGNIQVLMPNELPFAQPLISNEKFDAFGNMSKAAKTGVDGKATRMSQSELHQLLFKLFQEYDYWTLKGLIESTNQPVNYLKEVLGQLCIFHKSGPYMHNYELKLEYKNKNQENDLPRKTPGGKTPTTSGQGDVSDYSDSGNVLEDSFDDIGGDDDDDDMDDVVFDQVN